MKPMYDDHFSSMNPILSAKLFFSDICFCFLGGFCMSTLLDFNVGSISLLAFALNLFVFLE